MKKKDKKVLEGLYLECYSIARRMVMLSRIAFKNNTIEFEDEHRQKLKDQYYRYKDFLSRILYVFSGQSYINDCNDPFIIWILRDRGKPRKFPYNLGDWQKDAVPRIFLMYGYDILDRMASIEEGTEKCKSFEDVQIKTELDRMYLIYFNGVEGNHPTMKQFIDDAYFWGLEDNII